MLQHARVLFLLFLTLLAHGCAGAPAKAPPLQPASPDTLRKSVEYLTSPELEGRGMRTAGLESAAQYIAGYFKGLELEVPPRQGDYLAAFPHKVLDGVGPETSLAINGVELKPGEGYQPLPISAEKSFNGPIVFAGFGVTAKKDRDGKEIEYDDFAGLDLKGKIVLVMRFEPVDDKGRSRLSKQGFSDAASLSSKAKLAAARGAAALLFVHPPLHHGPEVLSGFSRRPGEGPGAIPVIHIRQKTANELLKKAGADDLKTLQAGLNKAFTPNSFELKDSRAEGKVVYKWSHFELKNVSAMLPGRGRFKDQVIVIGAHYDHLGFGEPGSLPMHANKMHPGADDNGSGTAALLELARLLKQAGPHSRSILFIAFAGEEQGLLGSKYWVDHPSVPLEKIVAMVNLDMVGRVSNDNVIIGGSATATEFEPILRDIDAGTPLKFMFKSDWANGLAPSDITSFVLKRIPSIFFFTGVHPDYHRPTDTAEKINYKSMAQLVDAAGKLVGRMSEMETIPWANPPMKPGGGILSTTRPSTRPGTGPATSPANDDPDRGLLRPGGASLGVVPDYGAESPDGVKISGTSPGSAAEKAGLKPNDIITHWDDQKLDNLEDLMKCLNGATPGTPVKLKVIRDGKTITIEAVPTERQRRTQ